MWPADEIFTESPLLKALKKPLNSMRPDEYQAVRQTMIRALNGEDWTRDYKPWAEIEQAPGLTTCMWCGCEVHSDQVDEHEAECERGA